MAPGPPSVLRRALRAVLILLVASRLATALLFLCGDAPVARHGAMVRRTHAALARAVSGTGRTLEVHVRRPSTVVALLQPHIPPSPSSAAARARAGVPRLSERALAAQTPGARPPRGRARRATATSPS